MSLKYRITIRYKFLDILCINTIFFSDATFRKGSGHPHGRGFTITLGRNPLDQWALRSRDLYLTTLTMHKRQTSISLVGFKHAIPSIERSQTDALDRAVTGMSPSKQYPLYQLDQ